MTNFSYMSIVLGYSGLMFVVGSLTAFMPKFLEVSFSKSSGSANLTFGKALCSCGDVTASNTINHGQIDPSVYIYTGFSRIILKKFGSDNVENY